MTDKLDELTHDFDVEIVLANTKNSYLDKIEMLNNLPFDENIFLDADIIAYSDLNILFDLFKQSGDFSCFGKVYYDRHGGWFDCDLLPDKWKNIQYSVGLHGGII